MSKTKELWSYLAEEKVWVGKYLNSHNISHWHTDNEIVHVDQGELDVMLDGLIYSLKKGDIIFIDSKKIHNMHATKNNTIVSIIIFDNSLIKKHLSQFSLETPVLKGKYKLSTIYSSLFKELTEKPIFYQENTKLLVQSLILDIYRNEKLIDNKNSKKFNGKLLELIDVINNNYRYFTFDDASKMMNMNPSYFSRFFHNMIGIPFAKYLNCVKVEKAVELISEKPYMMMSEVADLCGFQTVRNFNRIFKSYTHYSPKNIPKGYVFNGLTLFNSFNVNNPTLYNCKLIEYSSPHN